MTEATARAPQSQSMIDVISKTASMKASGQMHRTGPKAPQTQDSDNAKDRVQDRSVDKPDRQDSHSDGKSVDTAAKVSEKPRRQRDEQSDSENSFEDTIDKLGGQKTANDAAAAASTPAPVGWTAELALRQMANDQTLNDTLPDGANADKTPNRRMSANLLKQDSVVALLDAKQRLQAAQNGAAQTPDQPVEETITSTITVNSRETHWDFANAASATDAKAFETLATKDGKANPVATLSAATPDKGDVSQIKPSGDGTLAAAATDVKSAGDPAPRQNYDGTQGGKSGGREQAAAENVAARRAFDTVATAPTEQVSPDAAETVGNMSGATQQVRSGVLAALNGNTNSAPPSNAPHFMDRPPATGQVLRTIDLTLSPPDLGTVRLKLSLKSSALDIDAEASKASTAKLLDDDRKGLEQSLRDAGYDVKSLKIAEASASNNSSLNSSLNNGGSSFQDGSQARSNLAGRQGENMQGREGGTPDQSQQRSRDNEPKASPATDAGGGRQANAIYI